MEVYDTLRIQNPAKKMMSGQYSTVSLYFRTRCPMYRNDTAAMAMSALSGSQMPNRCRTYTGMSRAKHRTPRTHSFFRVKMRSMSSRAISRAGKNQISPMAFQLPNRLPDPKRTAFRMSGTPV